MRPKCEQMIAQIVKQHPDWNGDRIAYHLRVNDSGAPGRSAIYECLARLRISGNIPAKPQPPTVSDEQTRLFEKENQDLQRTIEQYARERAAQYVIPSATNGTIRYGVIGDTQFGSLYCRLDALMAFYKYAAKRGITDILHAGDVLDGWRVYRGQEWELRDRGWEEQLDRLEKDSPKIKGIKTHFITGNHDASFKIPIGINVGEKIAEARSDFHFLGEDTGRIVFENKAKVKWIVDLIHPSGGTAYAISYHAQKIIDSLSGGTKPNMIAIGHYHKAEILPQYRNVVSVQVGTFQSQTPYMARKHLAAHIGGWLFEIVPGEPPGTLVNTINMQFVSFFEPIIGGEPGEKNG